MEQSDTIRVLLQEKKNKNVSYASASLKKVQLVIDFEG